MKDVIIVLLNLDKNYFTNYKEILTFIKGYDANYKFNEINIAALKRRGNYIVIPKTTESDEFNSCVKKTFPILQ